MQAWLFFEHARARCDELRAEAERSRRARVARVGDRRMRRLVAAALLAIGSSFVAASRRVFDDAALVN